MIMLQLQRVMVAISGGVDSAVSALLLKRQGYDVEGVFMSNWDQRDEYGYCNSDKDYAAAIDVCQRLDIKLHRAEFVKEYWTDVFRYNTQRIPLLLDIQRGYTPNPDVVCNEKIKFGVLRKHIVNEMGVSLMATGHYARTHKRHDGMVELLKSADDVKDQTYFLSTVSQESLRNVIFPIGHMTKGCVRQVACEAGLMKAVNRKESMGLCFIGKRKFPSFLKEYIEDKEGLFVSHDGQVIGEHKGHHHYTIGQRARLSGHEEAWFVSGKDPRANTVTIVKGGENPLLYSVKFKTGPAHWIREEMVCGDNRILQARYRHQQTLLSVSVTSCDDGLIVTSKEPMRAVTPGQYVVLYHGEECLGGACIEEVFPMTSNDQSK